MKNSELLKTLGSMNESEFREFGKFIASPYFNNRSEIVRLYDALKKYYPTFSSNSFKEELIFSKVYPGKKFSGVLMRKVFSLTTSLAMSFFAVKAFEDDKLGYNVKLLDRLREKNLAGLFEKRSKTIEGLLNKLPHTYGYYSSQFEFTTVRNGYFLHTDEKSMVQGLQKEIDTFTEYFTSVILLLYMRLHEWSKAFSIKTDLKLYDEILSFLERYDHSNITLVNLNFTMLKLLTTEDEKYYFELLEGRKKFEKVLHETDDYNIAITLMQYCYKKVVKGDTRFRNQQFEVLNILLEKNMLPPGDIEPYFYINSVRNAAAIGKFEWCDDFISKYKIRLNAELRSETADCAAALTDFYRKNFEKALMYVSKINTDRSTLKPEFRNIQLMIYYELNYNEELLSLLDTYRHFLSREKTIAEKTRNAGSEFIRLVSRLLKSAREPGLEKAELLKREIENLPYFNFREWFLEKLDEIINKKSRQ